MADKKEKPASININGSVLGIGNVIGNNSSSHVEIKFSLFQNQIVLGEKKTALERNPNFSADITRAFAAHPDAAQPELNHLIGHQAEMNRLLELYDYAARQNKGAFVFITGQYGYGVKSLGRAFVDAVRRGRGRAALTRFWEESNESHSRRDARWNQGFHRWQEIFDPAPQFLKTEDMFPFWGLFFQLCEQLPWLENTPLPSKLNDLPAYFRNCTLSGEPLVLFLEDFEYASADWYKTIRYLSKEAAHALPILWIVAMQSERPLDQIPDNERTPAQILALEFAKNNAAEIYHLSRITRQEVESYIAPAEDGTAERLHRMTGGVPILIQNLWQDWRRTETVFQNKNRRWEMNNESPWVEYGSGRDYVRDMLEQLWVEEKAPWSVAQMYDMLALAAQEGATFTVEALARAFNIEAEVLSRELEYLLDEPDDPGLLKESTPIHLELQSADWKKTLERHTFSPLLVWFTLTTYDTPEEVRLISYAEGLRNASHPFVERFASILANLYEKARQPEMAKKYRGLILENDDLRKLMLQAELLLEFPDSEIVQSRLHYLAYEIYKSYAASIYPVWTANFASRLLESFEACQLTSFLGIPLLLLAYSKLSMGDYQAARRYYEKKLAIEEKLGSKSGIIAALYGLGHVAWILGDYREARGYYERQLAVEEELDSYYGITNAFGGLGRVANSLGEYQLARGYYEKQLTIDEKIGRKDGIADMLSGLGDVANSLGEYQLARGYYERMLTIAQEIGIKIGVAVALSGLGDTASSLGEYEMAREYYEKQLAIEEDLGRKDGIADALSGLGGVAKSLGEYKLARGYFEKMSSITKELGIKKEVAVSLFGLASVASSLGDFHSAHEYYQEQLVIVEDLGHKDGIASAFSGLGYVASSLGDFESAQRYYEKMLTLSEELGRVDGVTIALRGLGDAASSMGNYQSARGYYSRALTIFENLGSSYIQIIKEHIEKLDDIIRGKHESEA